MTWLHKYVNAEVHSELCKPQLLLLHAFLCVARAVCAVLSLTLLSQTVGNSPKHDMLLLKWWHVVGWTTE